MSKNAMLLVLLFLLLRKRAFVPVVPSPNTTKHPEPNPPAWWPGTPEPPGWPAGAPWPPFDDKGNWVLPKDASGNVMKFGV